MKRTLEALVGALALSMTGCAANTPTLTTDVPSSPVPAADGKYDSVDDLINPETIQTLKKTSYMVISESKYKNSEGKEIILHSLGTAVVYKDIGSKTYLATADHLVQNEDVLFSLFKGKLEKVSEQFYLLEDDEVDMLHESLRELEQSKSKDAFFIEDSLGNRREPANYIVHTSSEIASILSVLKPKKIAVVAQNETKDLAVISVPRLSHPQLPYSIGNANELQPQNLVFVIGYPRGLLENITRGFVTSEHDSKLARPDDRTRFIFDASISPGNSGGGIFAVRDGKLELVGITSAMYLGANDLYIGAKINGISEVFKGNSIHCDKGWKCNLSALYKMNL